MSYVSFDCVIALVQHANVEAQMAKSDIESVFHLLLVHHICYHFLGCMVDGFYFMTLVYHGMLDLLTLFLSLGSWNCLRMQQGLLVLVPFWAWFGARSIGRTRGVRPVCDAI